MEKRRISWQRNSGKKRVKALDVIEDCDPMETSQGASMMTCMRSSLYEGQVGDNSINDPADSSKNNSNSVPKYESQNTVDMSSQSPEYCDETGCDSFEIESDNFGDNKCELLKQLSNDILKVSEAEDQIDGPRNDFCGVVAYMESVPSSIRTEIASYLSSGNLDNVNLTVDNIHHYYHVASNLNLKQLRDSCLKFCHTTNQMIVLSKFEGCGCKDDIEIESSRGYNRSVSIMSNPECNDAPQFYVVFSNDSSKTKKKVNVKVIDMNERRTVYNKEVEKMRLFGDGFACCTCEVKGTPIVYVSGGESSPQIVKKYDILLSRWDKCAKLIHGRSNHMMVTSDSGSLFVLGGSEVPCIEQYDLKTNKWAEKASLATQVISAACIYFKGKIYIFGGRTQAGPVATVQCYDTETHRVSVLPDLPCPFDGGEVVTLDDLCYIATYQGHMICFNPADWSSYLCTQQPVHRNRFGMFVKNERIYLVGGLLSNEEESSKIVPQYRYNPEKDLWVEKYKLCQTFPVYASCIINYEKKCCVIPFNESM